MGLASNPPGLAAQERREIQVSVTERVAQDLIDHFVIFEGVLRGFKARGDEGQLDLTIAGAVGDDAEDDVGVGINGRGDNLRGCMNLRQGEVGTGRDVVEDAGCARNVNLKQGILNCGLRRVRRPRAAAPVADGHEGLTGHGHDGSDVREVEVDLTGDGDELRDGVDALSKNIVRHAERVVPGGFRSGDGKEPLVRNDDEAVNAAVQGSDALFRLPGPVGSLKGERSRDDSDGERAGFPGNLGDNRELRRCRCRHPCRLQRRPCQSS